jgi:hypothetical protein
MADGTEIQMKMVMRLMDMIIPLLQKQDPDLLYFAFLSKWDMIRSYHSWNYRWAKDAKRTICLQVL